MLCTSKVVHECAHMLHTQRDMFAPKLNFCSHIQIIIFLEGLIKLLLQYCWAFNIKYKPDNVFLSIWSSLPLHPAEDSYPGNRLYFMHTYWVLICVRCLAQLSREVCQIHLVLRIIQDTYFFKKFWRPNPNTEPEFPGNKNPCYSDLQGGWRTVYRGWKSEQKVQLKDGENKACLKEEGKTQEEDHLLGDG